MSDGRGCRWYRLHILSPLLVPVPEIRVGAAIQRLHTFASVIGTGRDAGWQRMRMLASLRLISH